MFKNRTMERLEKMLDEAIEGNFVEKAYDETTLSRLESRWKDFLGSSVLSNQNLEKERHRLEQFISDISHQTKTPMTNIKMYSELLLEETERGEAADLSVVNGYARKIKEQNERLEFLIDSLTKLSRLENGTLEIIPTENELGELMARAVAALESKATAKDIRLICENNEEIRARFDKKWTLEALINVMDNAVKYSPRGGTVKVFLKSFDMYAAIHVIDEGPGIGEEESAKIFGRFSRGRDVQQEEGIGIGLYLTREILEKEDGYISVVPNNRRKGGEFILCLKRQ